MTLFLLGMFWKRTTANAAIGVALGLAFLLLAFKLLWPALPFSDRVGLVFLLCVAIAVVVTLLENKGQAENATDLSGVSFSTSTEFNVGSIAVCLILTGFYVTWW
ncbi:MAG: SSS family solute:Na+ symporter [Paraglaciecola sp.]